ncbi:ParA family protein [Gordonia alkanivorans]|uniref:ParA family protein n=1 Tax=Gordonia alkanivorans TaxID=84096 RepID=UPI0005A638B8|nr:ParA family protein [Gordonia alkanivorans]
MSVYTFINQKGGCGKSTLAVNVAASFSQVAKANSDSPDVDSPTLLLSVDPQGSAAWWADRVEKLPFRVAQVQPGSPPDLIHRLPQVPGVKNIVVDTPGWIGETPGGSIGPSMDAVLDITTLAIVPITTEPLSYDPTARTILKVLQPRGIPFLVVINSWDPRDGQVDLEQTQEFVKSFGWPLAETTVRRYKLHARAAADGRIATEYPANRIGLQAREDFHLLSLDLVMGGGR